MFNLNQQIDRNITLSSVNILTSACMLIQNCGSLLMIVWSFHLVVIVIKKKEKGNWPCSWLTLKDNQVNLGWFWAVHAALCITNSIIFVSFAFRHWTRTHHSLSHTSFLYNAPMLCYLLDLPTVILNLISSLFIFCCVFSNLGYMCDQERNWFGATWHIKHLHSTWW